MKKILTGLAAIAIVAGAYIWSFGVPDVVSPDASNQAPAQQGAGGPGPGRPGGGGATTVVLTALAMEPYEDIFRAIGNSEAVRSATVSSDVAGRVVEVNLTANAQVSQGDVLVRLDARAATLNLESVQGALEQATDTVARYERLQQSSSSSISDVALSEARLALQVAEVNVGLAELALEDRTILAPISGRLGLSEVNVGDYISANDAIVTVDDASALLVEFELPERSVSFLSPGREVVLGTPTLTGRNFTGEIVSFDSRIDEVTRSVTVKARVENPDAVLTPGMTFTVRLANQSEPLAVLPSTAITWSREGASIWYSIDGRAESAPATILFRRDELVWLDVDLPVGTLVVTEGAHKLRPGAAISDANAAPDKSNEAPA